MDKYQELTIFVVHQRTNAETIATIMLMMVLMRMAVSLYIAKQITLINCLSKQLLIEVSSLCIWRSKTTRSEEATKMYNSDRICQQRSSIKIILTNEKRQHARKKRTANKSFHASSTDFRAISLLLSFTLINMCLCPTQRLYLFQFIYFCRFITRCVAFCCCFCCSTSNVFYILILLLPWRSPHFLNIKIVVT